MRVQATHVGSQRGAIVAAVVARAATSYGRFLARARMKNHKFPPVEERETNELCESEEGADRSSSMGEKNKILVVRLHLLT